MSEANETNQSKPRFEIKSCDVCPAMCVCVFFMSDSEFNPEFKDCTAKKEIEKLVNNN